MRKSTFIWKRRSMASSICMVSLLKLLATIQIISASFLLRTPSSTDRSVFAVSSSNLRRPPRFMKRSCASSRKTMQRLRRLAMAMMRLSVFEPPATKPVSRLAAEWNRIGRRSSLARKLASLVLPVPAGPLNITLNVLLMPYSAYSARR